MKRLLLALFVCMVLLPVSAQQRRASKMDVTNYPEVSFVWNEYNPDIVEKSQVDLRVAGNSVPFTWSHQSNPRIENRHKSVMILWEDMAGHPGQSDFTRVMLTEFFNKDISAGDRFNVVVFNRDHADGNFLRTITNGFSDDTYQVLQSVRGHDNDRRNTDLQSNVYQAINEGLSLFDREPQDNIKVIFLVTAGYNMQSAGAPKEFSNIEAIRRNIPIYIVKFPLNGDRSRKDVDGIETSTYGEMIIPSTRRDAAGAANYLYDSYQRIDRRHYGQDYAVTFTATDKKDGLVHDAVLVIRGVNHKVQYTAPKATFGDWVKDNVVWAILIGVGILLIIGVIVFLVVRSSKKRKQREAERVAEMDRKNKQALEAQRLANEKHDKAMREQMAAQERARKEAAAAAAAAAAQKEAQAEREKQLEEERKRQEQLASIMKTKNLYPRLIYTCNGQNTSYCIQKPFIKLGRTSDNDVSFPDNKTVSRSHALITFNGSNFNIQNLSMTNKTIVNGQFVDISPLKNGDIIGLGSVVINFYL